MNTKTFVIVDIYRTVVPIVTLAMLAASTLAFCNKVVMTFSIPSFGLEVVGDLCLWESDG